MELFDSLKNKIKGKNLKIVFPEGNDERVLKACVKLKNEGLVDPIVLGNASEINELAQQNDLDVTGLKVINPSESDVAKNGMLAALVKRRNGKTDESTAKKWLSDPNYFGTMMVYMNLADGMVSGAAHPTGDTIRPALQIIKTKPGVKLVSGAFVMQKGDQRFLFADCAITPDPNEDQLADIAITSGDTAKLFDIDPKVALLSYSTKGSAAGPAVSKVQNATQIAKEKHPDFPLDGELQFDAALVPMVAAKKAPDSDVAGNANVFVFPELQSGNIGYKIVQRLGGFEAIGPILQGLNQPVSDLSRGCSAEDVYKVAIVNAVQSLEAK